MHSGKLGALVRWSKAARSVLPSSAAAAAVASENTAGLTKTNTPTPSSADSIVEKNENDKPAPFDYASFLQRTVGKLVEYPTTKTAASVQSGTEFFRGLVSQIKATPLVQKEIVNTLATQLATKRIQPSDWLPVFAKLEGGAEITAAVQRVMAMTDMPSWSSVISEVQKSNPTAAKLLEHLNSLSTSALEYQNAVKAAVEELVKDGFLPAPLSQQQMNELVTRWLLFRKERLQQSIENMWHVTPTHERLEGISLTMGQISNAAYTDPTARPAFLDSYSLVSDLSDVHHAVYVSDAARTVVIGLRGTAAFEDIATDVEIIFGDRKHARWMKAEEKYRSVAERYPEYRVIATGHSLGGSLALHLARTQNIPAEVFNPAIGPKDAAPLDCIVHVVVGDPVSALARAKGFNPRVYAGAGFRVHGLSVFVPHTSAGPSPDTQIREALQEKAKKDSAKVEILR